MKEKIEKLITEYLERYDMELPNYEYDTVADELAERIVNLLNVNTVKLREVCPFQDECSFYQNDLIRNSVDDDNCKARE